MFQIVAMLCKVARQHVQQIRIPWFRLHGIGWVNDSSSHHAMPQSIDDGPGESAVLRMRHEGGKLPKSLVGFCIRVDVSQFGKQPFGFRGFANRFIAAVNFKILCRIDCRQTVGFLQFPSIHKTVVARSALQIDAEQRLRHTLGKLNFDRLAGTHFTSPFDPLDETSALVGRGRDEFSHKLIVGFVVQQRLVQPSAYLFATTSDETCTSVVISQ